MEEKSIPKVFVKFWFPKKRVLIKNVKIVWQIKMSFIQNKKKCIRLVIMVINTQDGNSYLLLFIMLPGILRSQKKKNLPNVAR